MVVDAALCAAFALTSIVGPQPPALAPMARSVEEFQRRLDIDKALKMYWSGLSGFSSTDDEDPQVARASGKFGATYGECTTEGARAIFDVLGLLRASDDDQPTDVYFADLGSGVGKLAAQAYVELCIDGVLAVELGERRHERAKEGWKRFVLSDDARRLKKGTFDENELTFLRADATAVDLTGVTHCFVANLCFDDEANARLSDHLARAPALRKVAVLRELTHADFSLTRRSRAQMSWNPIGQASDLILYEKKGEKTHNTMGHQSS